LGDCQNLNLKLFTLYPPSLVIVRELGSWAITNHSYGAMGKVVGGNENFSYWYG